MASDVDICNLALAHLGDSAIVATIDPPDGSVQSEHCARFYPAARDALLEMHQWGFATRRAPMALIDQPGTPWAYRYAVPNEALNIVAVLPSEAADDYSVSAWGQLNPAYPLSTYGAYTPQRFDMESMDTGAHVILTNQGHAVLRYTVRVMNSASFSPLFVDCLAWLLASHLAGPMLKGDSGAQAATRCYSVFKARLADAVESDANQRRVNPAHNVPWLTAR